MVFKGEPPQFYQYRALAYMPLPVKVAVHNGLCPDLGMLCNLIDIPASNVHSVLHAATAGAMYSLATVDPGCQKVLLEPHVEVRRGHSLLLEAALVPGQRSGEEVDNGVASGGVGVQTLMQLSEAAVRSSLDGELHWTILGTSLGIVWHPSHLLPDGQEENRVDTGCGGLACSKKGS